MSKFINTLFKAICLSVIISVVMTICSVKLVCYIANQTEVSVPGHIYGKYVGQEHHKHYNSDVFNIAVHPNDDKYKDYSVVVDYSTFARYNVGDNISFRQSIFDVTEASKYNGCFNAFMIILCGILIFGGIYVTWIPLDFYLKNSGKV